MFPLPPELSQIIIDQLWDDTRSLQTICLVSKAGIPLARKHLFYEVKVYFQDQAKCTRLLSVLKSLTKPGEYVRSLWLIGSASYLDSHVYYKRQETTDISKESRIVIQQVMAYIRFIREFHVESCSGGVLGSDYSLGLLRLRQVAIATFQQVTFISIADLVETLSYMPHCHSLRLENVTFGREKVSEAAVDTKTVTSLRTLYLGLVSKGAFLEWLLANSTHDQRQMYNGPGTRITTLILKRITLDESRTVKELLRSLGDTLEHLDITLTVDRSAADVAKNIDLRHNTHLRFLAFDDWLMSRFACPPEWCTVILKSLTFGSRELDTVVLRFGTSYAGLIETSNIKLLQNEILFPNLRTVVFENRRYLQTELALRHLQDRLPGLSTRGSIEYKMIPEDTLYHWRTLHTSRIYDETQAILS